ncbi:MAG: hypothetical protein GX028_07570 [Clostridiaceae bacterium]|nr:hypothetical protein [Clostridiaceae bacterium]
MVVRIVARTEAVAHIVVVVRIAAEPVGAGLGAVVRNLAVATIGDVAAASVHVVRADRLLDRKPAADRYRSDLRTAEVGRHSLVVAHIVHC